MKNIRPSTKALELGAWSLGGLGLALSGSERNARSIFPRRGARGARGQPPGRSPAANGALSTPHGRGD